MAGKNIDLFAPDDGNDFSAVDNLIIDVSYMAQRHRHAMGDRIKTSEGRISGHVLGSFKNLAQLRRNLRPGKVIFCYDRGYDWRTKLVPEYKATRRVDVKDDSTWTPAPEVEQLFRAFPGYHLAVDGAEADDLIALAAKEEGSTIIYSSDRDLWQLVDDTQQVACMYPRKGGPRKRTMDVTVTEQVVKQELGVAPSDLAKLKALAGDVSDNTKGVQGGSRKGKKEAILSYAGSPASDSFFAGTEANMLLLPEWLIEPMMEQRQRLIANYTITDLSTVGSRIEINMEDHRTEGSLADVMETLLEFECDSLLAQAKPLFDSMSESLKHG